MGQGYNIRNSFERRRQNAFDYLCLWLSGCAISWDVRSLGLEQLVVSFATDDGPQCSSNHEAFPELYVFKHDFEAIFASPDMLLTQSNLEKKWLSECYGAACAIECN